METLPLAVSDLSVSTTEPRILDVRLGERLGMAQPLDIRRTIDVNRPELERYGEVFARRAKTSVRGGRPTTEYHLNEPQALILCMLSRTARAADVRQEVITVFMAWRRGEVDRASPPPTDPLSTLEQRLATLERMAGLQATTESAAFARLLPHLILVGRRKRYPAFWGDIEVREYLIKTHRQAPLNGVRAALIARVGIERTPSLSAIHRFWMQLDVARSATAASSRKQLN
jgi:hypothetical protein